MKVSTIVAILALVASLNVNLSATDNDEIIKKASKCCPIAKCFIEGDTNKDEKLSKDELVANSKQKAKKAEKLAKKMIKMMDTDKDELISKDEYVAAFSKCKKK